MVGLGINDRVILQTINKVKELEIRIAKLESKQIPEIKTSPTSETKSIKE